SSRRRHTRFSRDWSSDVCSSDLGAGLAGAVPAWGTAVGALGQVAAEAEAKSPPRFIRVVESKSGQNVRLELVIRSFAPAEGEGRTEERRVGEGGRARGGEGGEQR